jgi:hypothetical protein
MTAADQATNPNTSPNICNAVPAKGAALQKETKMELLAKAYLLFLTLLMLATTINNAGELEPRTRRYALVGTGLAVLAVLIVW